MDKSFAVESVQTFGEAGSGKFEALVSVFGNVDAVKDVVMDTAFNRAVKESDPPPVVWSHFWNIPPIGETLDWGPTDKGLSIKGELFVGADDKHQYADMVYAAMKSREGRKPALREFSFSYDIPDGGAKMAEREGVGKVQELHELFPVHEVGPCLKGCNPATQLINAPKSAWKEDLQTLITQGKISKDELLAMFEDEDESVREGEYPREYAELLLAVPDH
jgi:hypothetical protein